VFGNEMVKIYIENRVVKNVKKV